MTSNENPVKNNHDNTHENLNEYSLLKVLSHSVSEKDLHSTPFFKKNDQALDLAIAQIFNHQINSAFTKITQRPEYFESAQKWALELQSKYQFFVVIGIGGSSMGARALVEIADQTHQFFFFDNVDSFEFEKQWLKINPNLKNTAFLVISKSGSTVEVLLNYTALVEKAKALKSAHLISQSYFITEDQKNPLAEFAKSNQRPLIPVPTDIGGRYSVLTSVGLIIAGICNYNLNDIFSGAQKALAVNQKPLVKSLCHRYLYSMNQNQNMTVFWLYNSNYRWFGEWLKQLWAESLGKKQDRKKNKAFTFSTPVVLIGSSDQHSLLQQLIEGPKDKFIQFFDFTSTQEGLFIKDILFQEIDYLKNKNYGNLIKAQSQSTYQALIEHQAPCDHLQVLDQNKSLSLGYLFMFFQVIVATLGESQDIDSFDQPGVALGKVLTVQKLKK